MILRTRGYPPQDDTWLFADTLADHQTRKRVSSTSAPVPEHSPFRQPSWGAGSVTAIDISRRAVLTYQRSRARAHDPVLQGQLHRARSGRILRPGDLSPPYVPSEEDRIPGSGMARAWDAGTDRLLLDRICTQAPDVPGHARRAGFEGRRHRSGEIPFGPVLTARRRMLASRGIITADQRSEVIVVIRGRQHA